MSVVAALAVELGADLSALQASLQRGIGMLGSVSEAAVKSGAGIDAAMQASGGAAAQFARAVELAQAQLSRLNGDNLAVLRAQFNNLVPDSELAKLAEMQERLQEVARAERTVAMAVSEISAAYDAEMAAAERASAAAIAGAEKQRAAQIAAAEAARGPANKAGGKLAGGIASGLLEGAEALTVVGAATAVFASNFDRHMMEVKHNTTLSAEEFAKLRQGVLEMGQESGLPFESLARGMMHLANEGYTVEQSLKIGQIAMEGARATGSDAEQTFNLLAQTMHMFTLPVADASKAYNTLHVAANEGNVTVEQFVTSAGPAMAMAAAFKIPLNDVTAAFSAITRNGFNAAQTNTLLRGTIAAIAHPSKQSADAIRDLSQASGIDLVKDFAGVRDGSVTLTATMRDLFKATDGHASLIVSKLMPAMRGGMGATVLAGRGMDDLNAIFAKTSATMAGTLAPTHAQYVESMKLATSQTERLRNKIEAEFLPTGEKFAQLFIRLYPDIEKVASILQGLLDQFLKLPQPLQEAAIGLGAFGLASKALGNPLNATFNLLKTGIKWFGEYRAAAALAAGVTQTAGGAAAAGGTAAAGGGVGGALFGGVSRIGAGAAAIGARGTAVGALSALAVPAMLLASEGSAGQGGDLNRGTAAATENLIHFASQLQRNQEALDAFHRQTVTEQAHTVALLGAGTADAYEAELKRNVAALKARVTSLQTVMRAENAHASTLPTAASPLASSALATSAASEEQLEARMAAMAARRKAEADAEKARKAELKKFTSDLAAEQAKLTEAHNGGSKASESYAAHLSGLTAAHRAQVLAVHTQVLAAQEAEKSETKFHQALSETENRIRAANGTELGGLEKLKAAYPGVSESRLTYLLHMQETAKAAEEETKQHEKLATTLSGLQSELTAGTEGNKLHAEAVALTGKAYEDLSASSQTLVTRIANVKKEMADHKAIEEMHKKVSEAADKLKTLQLPPLERGLVQFVGGLKVFDQMSASVQEAARAQFILVKAHEAAGSAWDAGTRGLSLYDAALSTLNRTAAATRRELGATGDQLNSQSKQMADLELQMLQRVASGRAGTFEQQATAQRELQGERQAEEYFAGRYGANSRTGAGDIDSARRLQDDIAHSPNEQQRMAAEHVLQRNFSKGVLDQLADESKLRSLQGEVEGTRDKSAKLQNQLKENQGEITSFQAGMNKIPGMNGAVAKSFDPVVISLQRTGAAFDALGKSASEAMSKINFPEGGFAPEKQGINGTTVPQGSQGITGSDGSIYSQAHRQGVFAGDGFAQGLKDSTEGAQQASGAMAQSAIDTVSDMLGIQSPSTVFAQIGQYTVDGLAVGIKNGTRTVAEAASGLVRMTVAQAMAAVPSTLSQQQASMQAGISEQFAAEVVRKARQANLLLGESLGASNPAGVGAFENAQYAELKREAMNYSSLVVGGQTINRQDSANQLAGNVTHNYFNMTIHTPDVAGFQMSRQQIMQDMYEQGQSYSQKNG